MKKTRIAMTLVVALGVWGATGCAGFLDVNPDMKETSNNFYLTEEQTFQSLTSAYSVLCISAPQTSISTNYVNCAFEITSEILGDCCYAGGEAGAAYDQSTYRRSTFTTTANDNAAEALWRKYYMGIDRCNTFFVHADDAPFKNEDTRARYKAEAHFLRAYYFFDLARLFGNICLPLRELTPADWDFPQSSPAETYGQIASDLLAAINATGGDGNPVMYADAVAVPSDMKGRVSLAAAKSLLARVWLYYTGYYGQSELPVAGGGTVGAATVRGYLTDVITGTGHDLMPNAYDLTSVASVGVTPLFVVANNNNAESVFEIQFSGLGKAGYGNRIDSRGNQAVLLWGMRTDAAPYAKGWSYAPVDPALWGKFDAADPRRKATIINTADEGISVPEPGFQHTGFFGRKYTVLAANRQTLGGDAVLNWPNDYYVIRFADVLLMAAEMELLHGGSAATAWTYYRRVRERAMPGTVPATGTLTLDKIYDERLYELALEGHRYWDILRRGQDYAATALTKVSGTQFMSVTYDRTRAGLLPIPLYEIVQSKYTLKQNPGYSN